MPGKRAVHITVSERQQEILEQIVRRHNSPQQEVKRVQIVVLAAKGAVNADIAKTVRVSRQAVRKWRQRWLRMEPRLAAAEQDCDDNKALMQLIRESLSDNPRRGRPAEITPEQICQIVAIACEKPEDCGRPISHWTHRELADEVMKRQIIGEISHRSVGRFLKEADIKPHQSRYWLHAKYGDPEVFKEQVTTVCDTYAKAPQSLKEGIHTISTDEMTGIQALERLNPTLPPKQGEVERREFEYIRHGTQTLIASFDVATGRVVSPSVGDTRTEQDFVEHVAQLVRTDPTAGWIFVMDQLNTHKSESLVRWVAQECEINEDLGEKGKRGILKSMESRSDFLQCPSHRIRFVFTPKHASWLNQVEIWFSILVRKLLRRASFVSTAQLKERIHAFIDYFNATMAKPFKWTYSGRSLVA
jgi:transposase